MPVLTRSVRGSASQLLYHVLEEPQLMAAVRELPAPALVRLIHHVGLEDAGELIALTSTQQLGQVFDAELWQAAEPGSDETFRPERFAMFLRLLYEAGETFVVERLQAMPRELLTLAIHKLLLVIDIDALTVRFASAGRFFDDGMDRVSRAIDDAQFEEWEEFRLIARDPNAFEDVWNALLALDRENHELVRYIMERCCDMDGELIEESGLYAVLNEEELLENDIASERSDRRAAQGFVSPADARAFLELARRDTIDEAPDGRDPISRAYFRELAPEQPTATGRALPARGAAAPDVGRLLTVLRKANVFDDELDAPSPSKLLAARGKSANIIQERSINEVAAESGVSTRSAAASAGSRKGDAASTKSAAASGEGAKGAAVSGAGARSAAASAASKKGDAASRKTAVAGGEGAKGAAASGAGARSAGASGASKKGHAASTKSAAAGGEGAKGAAASGVSKKGDAASTKSAVGGGEGAKGAAASGVSTRSAASAASGKGDAVSGARLGAAEVSIASAKSATASGEGAKSAAVSGGHAKGADRAAQFGGGGVARKKGTSKRRARDVDSSAAIESAHSRTQEDDAGTPGERRLTLMASSMLVLREQDVALHAQRSEELGFLANVLVAGSRHDGRTYRPVEAIECALAVCSIGIEREHARRSRKAAQPTAAQGAALLRELSADRLFRTGLHALRVDLGERARAAVAQLLRIKLAEVPAAISGGAASLVPQLAIDGPDAVALAALAEPEPWLTGALAAPDHLFVACQKDLEAALDFLGRLDL